MGNTEFFTIAPNLNDNPLSDVGNKKKELSEKTEIRTLVKCPKCNADVEIDQKFCVVCGAAISDRTQGNLFHCPKCGKEIGKNDSFCQKCGFALTQIQEKKLPAKHVSKKMIVVFSLIALVILLSVIIPVSISSNSPKNRIVGDWSTERGLDSKNYSFKSNGDLIYSEFGDSKTYNYRFDGNILIVSNKYDSVGYGYSGQAMSNDYSTSKEYWYIQNNVLYFRGLTLYRQ